MRIIRLSPLLLVFAASACDPSSGAAPQDVDAAGGKADGAAAVDVRPADEPLFSTALQRQLCGAIGDAHPWSTASRRNAFVDDCEQHDFTVTQTSTSRLYAHLDDGDPMTLQLRVRVEDGTHSWETSLTREFSEFQFRWVARVDSLPEGDDRDAFIQDIADAMGEFFRPDDHSQNFRMLDSLDEVPADVRAVITERVAEIDSGMSQGPGDEASGAFLSDERPHAIVRDGEVIGFAIQVEFFVDHVLFDGGGTTLYLNTLGEILEEVDWFG
jgi:hypothetical protein